MENIKKKLPEFLTIFNNLPPKEQTKFILAAKDEKEAHFAMLSNMFGIKFSNENIQEAMMYCYYEPIDCNNNDNNSNINNNNININNYDKKINQSFKNINNKNNINESININSNDTNSNDICAQIEQEFANIDNDTNIDNLYEKEAKESGISSRLLAACGVPGKIAKRKIKVLKEMNEYYKNKNDELSKTSRHDLFIEYQNKFKINDIFYKLDNKYKLFKTNSNKFNEQHFKITIPKANNREKARYASQILDCKIKCNEILNELEKCKCNLIIYGQVNNIIAKFDGYNSHKKNSNIDTNTLQACMQVNTNTQTLQPVNEKLFQYTLNILQKIDINIKDIKKKQLDLKNIVLSKYIGF